MGLSGAGMARLRSLVLKAKQLRLHDGDLLFPQHQDPTTEPRKAEPDPEAEGPFIIIPANLELLCHCIAHTFGGRAGQ